MNTVLVLVCDSARARFFEIRDDDPSWRDVGHDAHDASRSKAADLVSDHSGRRSSEGGSVHHNALAPASSPKEIEKEHFAHSLGKTLDQWSRSGRFRWWVLVAPPHFVGLMKKELTSELTKHLIATVDKEMSQFSVSQLAERLRDSVRIAMEQRDSQREDDKHAH
jgi:protein required for attachment to host cells